MKNGLILISVALLMFCSCNTGSNSISNTQYFDPVFHHTDSLFRSKPKLVISYLDSAFAAFPAPGIKDLYNKYAFKAKLYEGNRSETLTYADSMLWVIRDHIQDKEFAEDYANALLVKANVLIALKDFSGALECNTKARLAIEKTRDTCLLSTYTLMLGSISFKQGKFLDAAHYMLQGVHEMNACKDRFQVLYTTQARYDDIGICYSISNMLDSALYYYNYDISYLESQKDNLPEQKGYKHFIEIAEGIVYGNIGDIYLKKGDTATAEQLYIKGAWINGRKGYDHGDAQCTQEKLANIYLIRGRYNEAQQMLQRLKSSLDSFPEMDAELKWYRLQLEYLDKTGKKEQQYTYVKPYLKLKDSVAEIESMPRVDLNGELARQYRLLALQKSNELKSNYLTIVIIFSLLALAIAALLWYNWNRTGKLNAQVNKQNNEMQLAITSLTESQKYNTRLMQVVAHDLRNPIASMVSIASLLLENEVIQGDDREMLELMQTSGQHSIDMISDLMNVNSSSEGMEKEPADMQKLLQYCVDLLQFKASEKKQHIVLVAEPVTLTVNKEKIWRVISNLLVNAIKFSPEGSEINIKGYRANNDFRIVVRDQGIGIPDNMKNRVFNMFTDAKRPGTNGEPSFGLGLSISRQIVAAHGGQIWFESNEGLGTTFFILLPLKD